jgi:hypothetical protein
MMNPDERVLALVQSEMDYMSDRMTAMLEQPGNPMGVEMLRLDNAIAYYSRSMPWPLFNHVKGRLSPDDVEKVILFYEERDRQPELQIAPSLYEADTLKLLAKRGFYQSSFHVSMYKDSFKESDARLPDDKIEVRELSDDEWSTYGDIHCLGTGLSITGRDHVADNNRLLHDRPGWHYRLGLVDGRAASVGVMFVMNGMASFTFAATLPEERAKGLHTAILRDRLLLARQLGCRLVVAQCAYGSASHRNMERVGMRIGMTRSTWSKL